MSYIYVFELPLKKFICLIFKRYNLYISICLRKRLATPEDIEYYDCQQEMMCDLVQSYKKVERIIGNYDC